MRDFFSDGAHLLLPVLSKGPTLKKMLDFERYSILTEGFILLFFPPASQVNSLENFRNFSYPVSNILGICFFGIAGKAMRIRKSSLFYLLSTGNLHKISETKDSFRLVECNLTGSFRVAST